MALLCILPVWMTLLVPGEYSEFSTPPVFSVSPLPLEKIRAIIPLGNLNPRGGHVFPTDHAYLDYGAQPDQPIAAPAAGSVFAILDQARGDYKIEIRVNEHLCYYLAHLFVEPGIKQGSLVKAGQILGRASARSMLDLGAYDSRIRLKGFVRVSRYPPSTLHAVSPLGLFEEPLKGQLLAKVNRPITDNDGKIDFDLPGRLSGNWFHSSLSPEDSLIGRPEAWTRQLAFVYHGSDPKAVRISIGGTVAPAGIYAIPSDAPDPAQVKEDTGLVKYSLLTLEGEFPKRTGLLLVQLLDPNKMKVEFFANAIPGRTVGFTDKASLYER